MRTLSICMCVVILALLGTVHTQAAEEQPDSPIVAKCKADLSKRLKTPAKDIKLIKAEPVLWPDASLGMPAMCKSYAQVETPGHRVILESGHTQYVYTTGSKVFNYGGPVGLWSHSVLFLKPTPNNANLNGELYQSSSLGTNQSRLAEDVSDFYPQANGIIVIKRRTSRSFHDLLYIKADESGKETKLQTAVDFGDVSVNSSGKEYAAFVRPRMGAGWTVVAGLLGRGLVGELLWRTELPLPEGVQPSRITWVDKKLIILVGKDSGTLCYEANPKAEKPEWQETGTHNFPGLPPYVLNKSQQFVVEQVEDAEVPTVELASVWFTGSRDILAKITGLTMRGYDLLENGFVLVWGEEKGQPALYTVRMATGEAIPAICPIARDIKPFAFPPHTSPLQSTN